MRVILENLIQSYPSVPEYRSLLLDSVRNLAIATQANGHISQAIALYRQVIAELESKEEPTPTDLYDAACCRSLIAGAAMEASSGLTAADAQAEGEQSVAAVRLAFDAGFSPSNLKMVRDGDPDLKAIRSRPDFQLLMMDLAFPRDPFVR